MKKLLIINGVCGIKSTGKIVADIAKNYKNKGWKVFIAYGRENSSKQLENISYRIGSEFSVRVNAFLCRLFDNDGFASKSQTKKLLKWADTINPDELWLHNLHGYYLNVKLLFEWIKSRPQMTVNWTLHDCWAFTGHCVHFSFRKCYKWQSLCHKCPAKNEYPASWVLDRSKRNFELKKSAFLGVERLRLFVVSNWLKDLAQKSFLGIYPIETRYNSVDDTLFHFTPSNLRTKLDLEEKIVLLGVATAWSQKKGLYDFIQLSKVLPNKFQIVLIGIDDKTKEKFKISNKILCIPKTNDQIELAKFYSMSDLFLNLSYEETFGLTVVEAKKCGAKVLVYKDTACEEVLNLYGGGIIVDQNVSAVERTILELF